MYVLNKSQVNQVKKRIIASGVSYAPLVDELTDHICEQVEELINEGHSFSQALEKSLHRRQQTKFQHIDKSIFYHISKISMIRNYLKLGLRSLIKYKLVSSINLIGLVLGMTIFLLIGSYVYHELSFDRFHNSNIYRLTTQRTSKEGDIRRTAFSGAPWGPQIIKTVPDVANIVRIMKYRLPVSVKSEDQEKSFYEKDLIWAGQSFFSIFSFDLLLGNPTTVLNSPNLAVITESTAKRYFGNEDPIGKNIIYENDVILSITGVVKDFPPNSHIQADIIGSFSTLGKGFWFNIIDNWNILYYHTYLQLNNGVDLVSMKGKVLSVLVNHINERLSIDLQNISQIHITEGYENELLPTVDYKSLLIAGLIALTILLVSVINYINLSNARGLKRAKEVGVIKVMGSTKWLVFLQFMVESFVLSVVSMLASLLLVYLLFPYFNDFLGANIIVPPIYIIAFVATTIVFIVTVVSGSYTAIQMADLPIISALKGKLSIGISKGITFRKGLITFQFLSGIGLISATLIISDQVSYLVSADTGFSKENVIEMPLYTDDLQQTKIFQKGLMKLTAVKYVSLSSHRMSGDQLYRSIYYTATSDSLVMGRLHVDYDFTQTFGLELLAGRGFSRDFISDTSNFILNESAANLYGFSSLEDAIGSTLSYSAQNDNGNYIKTGTVVGIVKDFNFESLYNDIGPMAMDIQPARNHFFNVKLNDKVNYAPAIKQIESNWVKHFPNEPISFTSAKDRYLSQYKSETQLKKMVLTFSLITVLISSLGLFGLTYFDTVIRSKEIGLRKVLGSSTSGILKLFLKGYFVLILIGVVIITPTVLWLMKSWLSNFAYHISISSFSFIIPIILMGTVVVLTMSFTIIKAANNNPINSLNNE